MQLLKRVCKLLAITTIVAGVSGCTAPDGSGKPVTGPPATSESQPIVVIDLQRPLYRPVMLSNDHLRYVHEKVDELAAASKLAKLTSKSANEVRIWETIATFGPAPGYDTVGYVITPSRMSRCEIDYPVDGQPPFAGRCEILRRDSGGFDAARLLEPLLTYADTDMGCGVQDGVWYDLDIVHGERRFVISASNPDQCNDDGSAAVNSLLEAVHPRG